MIPVYAARGLIRRAGRAPLIFGGSGGTSRTATALVPSLMSRFMTEFYQAVFRS
jgi:hypothetical protein